MSEDSKTDLDESLGLPTEKVEFKPAPKEMKTLQPVRPVEVPVAPEVNMRMGEMAAQARSEGPDLKELKGDGLPTMPGMQIPGRNMHYDDIYTTSRSRISHSPDALFERAEKIADASGFEFTGEHKAFLVDFFTHHKNVFLTGSAGTGKSTFLKLLVFAEAEYQGLNMPVCAFTGVAAAPLKGRTINSWAGIGLGPDWGMQDVLTMSQQEREKVYDEAIAEYMDNHLLRGVRQRIAAAEVLVIDEVSMLPGRALLDYLDRLFRAIRPSKAHLAFGGIQMLMVGDFLQLPPVNKFALTSRQDWGFTSDSWQKAGIEVHYLTKVFRQDDPQFIEFLNELRMGRELTNQTYMYLHKFVRGIPFEMELKLTYLCPTNREADELNNRVRAMLPGEDVVVDAKFSIREDHLTHYAPLPKVIQQLEDASIHKNRMSLKVGSPVLLTRNGENYVNGTKGIVTKFLFTPKKVVDEEEGEALPTDAEEQEVILVYVKFLGMDGIEYEKGFGRGVITRGRHEPDDDLEIDPEDPEGVKTRRKWPVMFQFPLIPAHAITVHKSQGMTLDDCKITIVEGFAPGHVYVAVSRLRSPAGLYLTKAQLKPYADPEAVSLYENMQSKGHLYE